MATRTIGTPDPGFSGTRAGVAFRVGRGEVDAANAGALAYFARHGYALDEPPAPARRGRAPARPAEHDHLAETWLIITRFDPDAAAGQDISLWAETLPAGQRVDATFSSQMDPTNICRFSYPRPPRQLAGICSSSASLRR